MRSLDVSQSNFENQRKVVEEEYRMRVSNAPYVPAEIRLDSMVNAGLLALRAPGDRQDGTTSTPRSSSGCATFHDRYYAPNNAVLAIVGRLRPRRVHGARAEVLRPDPAAGERARVTTRARSPRKRRRATRSWRTTTRSSPAHHDGLADPARRATKDHYALELARDAPRATATARASIASLVREHAIATDVDVEHERPPRARHVQRDAQGRVVGAPSRRCSARSTPASSACSTRRRATTR